MLTLAKLISEVIKIMRKSNLLALSIILISFAIGIYSYPQMPEKVASHWNINGEVNSYMEKWGIFLMPIISIFLFLLFLAIPIIEPKKANLKKFRKYYDNFVIMIFLFLLYLHLLVIFWNIGGRFNMVQLLSIAFALLFYYCGILLENAKQNWFVGIRTPWTMMNEAVWNKTHKRGGKLFKISGVLALVAIVLPQYAIFFILVPVILSSIYVFTYSYFEYKKTTNKTKRK